jgi:autotransporter-associated beta strand protein
VGAGELILSGSHTYSGETRVEAGTLIVTGSLAAASGVTVGGGTFGTAGRMAAMTTATTAGASLGGTGTVAGTVTIADGGTLFVGLEPGTIGSLTIGSVVFESGSTLALDASPTAADQLTVNGSLTIGEGASVRATLLDGLVLDTDLIVMIKVPGANPVAGRFGTVAAEDAEGNKQIAGLMYAAGDGNDIALTSDVDPPTGGAVDDGQSGDIDFQVSLTAIAAKWSGFTDGAGSGIASFEWAIGTTPGGTDVMAFTSEGISGTGATRSGLSLTSGTTYSVSVRAIDNAGNVSTPVSSDGVMADAVAPVAGTVKDGPVAGSDITYQQSATSFSASWSGFADVNGSGIDRYEWAIGTTPGGHNVMAFTSVGTATTASTSGLSLNDNVRYFVTVKAIDRAGNATTVTSDGVTVYSLPPVVTAANIRLAGGTAGGGVFKPLDTVTATWNDTTAGDRNSHLIGSVSMDFSRFGGPEAVAATLNRGVWTATYRIAAGFTGTNRNVTVTITDLAGNTAIATGADNAMIAIPGGRADFTDSDGDRYRVQLTGPGLLAIDIDADGEGRGPIQRIQVAGTVLSGSDLKIVPLGSIRTSNRIVRIGSIAGTGLKSISAAASDLVGDGIQLTGPLGSLVIRDVADGTSIRAAGGGFAHRTSITARRIGDGCEIRLDSTLARLVAHEVGAARITAVALDKLSIARNARAGLAGNFAADLEVRGSLKTATIAGHLSHASWVIGDSVGALTVGGATDGLTVTVGGTLTSAKLGQVRGSAFDVTLRVKSFTSSTFIDSRLYVGFTPIDPADPMHGATRANFEWTQTTRIDSFSVTAKTAGAFAGSTIAASRIGTVSLSRVATDTPTRFGVLADESIRSVVVGRPAMRVSNRKAPGDLGMGQFRVRIV